MKQQPEFNLQCSIAEYLRLQYPSTPFLSDVRASMKLTIPQQVRSKKVQAADFAWPDMFIAVPRKGKAGLFLELKAESPFKVSGTGLKKDAHLERQAAAILQLKERGYDALFVWDFDQAKEIIDGYLKETNQEFAARLVRERRQAA